MSRLTGRLENASNGALLGSAAVLNSPSGTLIITAASRLGNKSEYGGQEGRRWKFRPAAGSRPSDPYSTTAWQSTRAWAAPPEQGSGGQDFSNIAIIELARDSQGRTIQQVAGGGLKPELNSAAPIPGLTIHGYQFPAQETQQACSDNQVQRQNAPAGQRGTRLRSSTCVMGLNAIGGPWADPTTMRILGTTSTSTTGGPNIPRGTTASDTTSPQFHELWNKALAATAGPAAPAQPPGVFPQPRQFTVRALPSSESEQERTQQWLKWPDVQPTGFYLPPGEKLSVSLAAPQGAGQVRLMVGTWKLFNPLNPAQPERQEPAFYPLTGPRTVTEVTDPIGGLLYVQYTAGSEARKLPAVTVTLGSAAQPIPYFLQGTTTALQWRTMLARSRLPWAQLAGRRTMLAVARDSARSQQQADPDRLLNEYARIQDAEDAIAGGCSSFPGKTGGQAVSW
ncbi:M60 family peptidase N-terminal accessory domain-containing protein [Streptomyces olivoreticuli]